MKSKVLNPLLQRQKTEDLVGKKVKKRKTYKRRTPAKSIKAETSKKSTAKERVTGVKKAEKPETSKTQTQTQKTTLTEKVVAPPPKPQPETQKPTEPTQTQIVGPTAPNPQQATTNAPASPQAPTQPASPTPIAQSSSPTSASPQAPATPASPDPKPQTATHDPQPAPVAPATPPQKKPDNQSSGSAFVAKQSDASQMPNVPPMRYQSEVKPQKPADNQTENPPTQKPPAAPAASAPPSTPAAKTESKPPQNPQPATPSTPPPTKSAATPSTPPPTKSAATPSTPPPTKSAATPPPSKTTGEAAKSTEKKEGDNKPNVQAATTRNDKNIHELKTALIIDDDPIMCKTFDMCLRKDFQVTAENSAAKGIVEAGQMKPNVIILDLFMPNVDGFEVLRQLRQHPGTAGIPVICCSGDSSSTVRDRVYQLGAIGFFPKPPNIKTFAEDVKTFLKNMNSLISSKDGSREFTIAFNEGEKEILIKDKILELHENKRDVIMFTWKEGDDLLDDGFSDVVESNKFYYLQIKPSLITKFPYMQDLKPIFTDMNSLIDTDVELEDPVLIFDEPSLLFNNDDEAALKAKVFSLGEQLTKNFKNILFYNTRSQDPRRSNITMLISSVFFEDF